MDVSFICWFRGIRVLFSPFSREVFIAEEVDEIGDSQCRDTPGCLLGELPGLGLFSTATVSEFPEH
jgi:hypothetical protein